MLKILLFLALCYLGVWLVRSVGAGPRRAGRGSGRAEAIDPERIVEAEFEVVDGDAVDEDRESS